MPTLSIDGIELHYERFPTTTDPGTERARPRVLLLHGLGSSTRDWEPQVDPLSRSFDVVACDLRGHGRSSKPRGPYDIGQLAGDVAALVQRLGLGPIHVVGLSMGAMVGLQLALDHPGLVRSLVMVNATTSAGMHPLRVRLIVWQRKLLVRLLGMRTLARVIAKRVFPRPEQGPLRSRMIERWPANDVDAYLRCVDAIAAWNVTSRLGELECDALIVSGDRDYTPVAAKQALVAALPSARLAVIPDSGHATPMDQPEAFNATLLAFLGRTPAVEHTMTP
jgi:3-oxoadipate enol-lactonase